MTCRCTSMAEHASRAAAQERSSMASSVEFYSKKVKDLETEVRRLSAPIDNTNFEILDYYPKNIEKPSFLMVTVKYNSCPNCSFEGVKILLYRGAIITDLLRWRNIDPHFRNVLPKTPAEAPGPVARFAANESGLAKSIVDHYNTSRPTTVYRNGQITLGRNDNPEEFKNLER